MLFLSSQFFEIVFIKNKLVGTSWLFCENDLLLLHECLH